MEVKFVAEEAGKVENIQNAQVRIEGAIIDSSQTVDSVDVKANEGLLLAEQNARDIIQKAEEEAEHIKASAERDANKIMAEARVNAKKQIERLTRDAQGMAKNRAQELLADALEEIRYQVPPEVERKIIQYACEIVSEAERTAQKLIDEAKKRASNVTDPISDKSSAGDISRTQQEPNAPNLLDELHKRFRQVKFGESQMKQQVSISGNRTHQEVCDFPVLTEPDNERIGTYSVNMHLGEIVAKRYQHNGRLLVVRGRITEDEYQSLQQFVDKGQPNEIYTKLHSLGKHNYVVYDFPVFIWNSRYGREDRYANDIKFP